jgi:CRISPR-associated protein Cmr4
MSYLHDLLFYQTVTPLHVGCGQDVGVVDLPVIRERTTGYPFIPGSGIRGSLRQVFGSRDAGSVPWLFGPTAEESETGPRHAGCVAVHDARLLLFPVRSDRAPFLWITCPAVLHRFSRDAQVFLAEPGAWPAPAAASPGDEKLLGPFLIQGAAPDEASQNEVKVYLEEMDFLVLAPPPDLSPWLAALGSALGVADLAERTAVVSDGTFHYFVTHATQVLQHNRLTSAKTVAQGQLFSVESVPPEAVFYGFLGATEPRRPMKEEGAEEEKQEADGPKTREQAFAALRGLFSGDGPCTWLQLGGDEGTGLGVTRIVRAGDAGESHAS